MRVRVFQHVPFEGTGTIAQWLADRSAQVEWTRFFRGDALPDITAYDWLIVMGGPMGACDDAACPWLPSERAAIRASLEAGRTVLGICLGAQLMAASLGALVRANPEREVGWYPVHRTGSSSRAGIAGAVPDGSVVFHWHGDTFDLPPGADGFLASDACRTQAFSLGERALGIQVHIETTVEAARALIDNCRGDLTPGRFVQSESEILGDRSRFEALRPILDRVMETMAGERPARA